MPKKDLFVLTACSNMKFTIDGLLGRSDSFKIRQISHKSLPHPNRDGGVRTTGPEIIAGNRREYEHGILILDWEGAGRESQDPEMIEAELDRRLKPQWGEKAKAIVIHPELDTWIWGSDNMLRQVLDWTGDLPIREWLRQQGFEFTESQKPTRPKEAFERILRQIPCPRSSALYKKIANRISIERCSDPAFLRLKATLQAWFGHTVGS